MICTESNLNLIACIVISYLFGSVPFGLLISKWYKIDIRKHGSGNIGATNIARVIGLKAAILVFVLDGLKGFVPTVFAKYYLCQDEILLVAFAPIIGHIMPIFLRFRGGKGVSTTIITSFVINPKAGLLLCIIWLTIFVFTRVSSLSAISSFVITSAVSYFIFDSNTNIFLIISTLMILITHKKNIYKILTRQETRF